MHATGTVQLPQSHFSFETVQLANLLGISPAEAARDDIDTKIAIVQKLFHALLVERARRGRNSWVYDPNRHINLASSMDREQKALVARAAELSPSQMKVALDCVAKIAA